MKCFSASSVTCTITAPTSQVPAVAQVDLTTSPCSSSGGCKLNSYELSHGYQIVRISWVVGFGFGIMSQISKQELRETLTLTLMLSLNNPNCKELDFNHFTLVRATENIYILLCLIPDNFTYQWGCPQE